MKVEKKDVVVDTTPEGETSSSQAEASVQEEGGPTLSPEDALRLLKEEVTAPYNHESDGVYSSLGIGVEEVLKEDGTPFTGPHEAMNDAVNSVIMEGMQKDRGSESIKHFENNISKRMLALLVYNQLTRF